MTGRAWRKSGHSGGGECAEVASWRKSTASGSMGDCAEVAAWRTATASDSGGCVEAGDGDAEVGIRDSTDRGGPVLTFTPEAWRAFTAALKA